MFSGDIHRSEFRVARNNRAETNNLFSRIYGDHDEFLATLDPSFEGFHSFRDDVDRTPLIKNRLAVVRAGRCPDCRTMYFEDCTGITRQSAAERKSSISLPAGHDDFVYHPFANSANRNCQSSAPRVFQINYDLRGVSAVQLAATKLRHPNRRLHLGL